MYKRQVPFEVNGNWRNRSFHNYADHALGDEFADALAELRDQAAETPTAVMCSEAVWWRCHRRIIADHLIAHGDEVGHIMGTTAEGASISNATLNDGAVVQGCIAYRRPLRRGPHNVANLVPVGDEVVGDDATVAAPPHCL